MEQAWLRQTERSLFSPPLLHTFCGLAHSILRLHHEGPLPSPFYGHRLRLRLMELLCLLPETQHAEWFWPPCGGHCYSFSKYLPVSFLCLGVRCTGLRVQGGQVLRKRSRPWAVTLTWDLTRPHASSLCLRQDFPCSA